MDASTPCVSFIGIVDFSQEARWLYASESCADLLGYEPKDLIGRPSLELVHPDEFKDVKQIHYDTISQDKAAVLLYLRMKHKDPYRGYVLCGVSRTVVHNVLVGSISYAAPGAKAFHNASTAQEITVVTPSAKNLELRRWNDPSPMPPSPIPPPMGLPRNKDGVITFEHLPNQSIRTALILDRFSMHCPVNYCSNDLLVSTIDIMGRSFYDFVAVKDEDIVRSWIDVVKSWGVNERGAPSDGGFGFGKFMLCVSGRDSSQSSNDGSSRNRQGTKGRQPSTSASKSARGIVGNPSRPRSTRNHGHPEVLIPVDAIFSAHSDGLMVILRKTS